MQVWLLEFFGSRELNTLFWLATASTAPFWLLMIGWPSSRVTRLVCRLWLAPPLLGVFYAYLLFLADDLTGLPRLQGVEMRNVRSYWAHPILFIALWMHRLVVDLFVGVWISRFGRAKAWEIRIELILVWLLGPIGMAVFAVRYWIAKAVSLRRGRA